MRYPIVMLATGTLLLTACQPPDDDKTEQGGAVPHPPIEETGEGAQVGEDSPGGQASPDTPDSSEAPSAQGEGAPLPDDQAATYESEDYHVTVAFPRELTVVNSRAGRLANVDANHNGSDQEDQAGGDNGAWKAFAEADSEGERLLTLRVPDQQAYFRLGASRATMALSHCKDQPTDAAGDTKATRTIDEVPFRRYEVTETGADNYRVVQSYRATYGEACFAIDLIAQGDGAAGNAAAQKQAMTQLQTVLDGIRFTD